MVIEKHTTTINLSLVITGLLISDVLLKIDDDLTAKINMADAKFSFQERNRVYQPAWMSPEGNF